MVFKLITAIISLVIIACFVGFNLGNSCDVNVLFYNFKDAPVIYTVLVSFILGIASTIPFLVKSYLDGRMTDKEKEQKKIQKALKKAKREEEAKRRKEEILKKRKEKKVPEIKEKNAPEAENKSEQ